MLRLYNVTATCTHFIIADLFYLAFAFPRVVPTVQNSAKEKIPPGTKISKRTTIDGNKKKVEEERF